jgi:hypothetical protein
MTEQVLLDTYYDQIRTSRSYAADRIGSSPGQERDRITVNNGDFRLKRRQKTLNFKGKSMEHNIRDEGGAGSNPATPTST